MNSAVKALTVVALILSVVAAQFLLFDPCWHQGITIIETLSGTRLEPSLTRCAAMVEADGWGVAVWVLLPVVFAAVSVFASWKRMVSAVWTVAVLALLFCFVTVFSIGLYFSPATFLLLAAAALQHAGRRKVSSPLEL